MNDDMSYEDACHALQAGVAFDQGSGSQDGTPKHLRVGIASAMATQAALADLLIERGLFTEKQYLEAVRRRMVIEVRLYEARLSQRLGKQIVLGSLREKS